MQIDIKTEGLRELDRALNQLPLRARSSILRGALNKAADPIVKEARALVPVRTGIGKKAISKRASTPRASTGFNTVVTIGFLSRAFYLRFIELGTSRIPAKPFLRPAFDRNIKAAMETFRKELRARIEKARGS